jgi:hypothetical protein
MSLAAVFGMPVRPLTEAEYLRNRRDELMRELAEVEAALDELYRKQPK